MSANLETLELLRSIDRSLKTLVANTKAAAPKAVASDRDLDGQYGNPIVKFNPRDWVGPSFKGQPMSQCPPPFLELLAETFDYFADKAEEAGELTPKGKPVADYKRTDARRARGWAQRIREGRAPAAVGEGNAADWADPGDDF